MEENENMKIAKEKLCEISEDAKMQRIAELREKAILDENEARETGYMEGKEEGREAGLREGREYNIPYNIPISVDTMEKGYPILCA